MSPSQKTLDDLRKVGDWSIIGQLPFSFRKCKVMHIGHQNPQSSYTLLGNSVDCTDAEKDLGVVISSDSKFSKRCIEAEKKALKSARLHQETVWFWQLGDCAHFVQFSCAAALGVRSPGLVSFQKGHHQT